MSSRLPVLEYHDVVDGNPDQSGFGGPAAAAYKVDQMVFERQLEAIAGLAPRLGTRLRHASGAAPVFTFDDGGSSAADLIAPALERRGWRGLFFVTTGQLGQPGFLSAAAVRALHDRGHGIGSHSVRHPLLMATLPEREIRQEWVESTAHLAEILGAPVRTASVPGGYFSAAVAHEAAAAGITELYTSEPVATPRLVAGITVWGRFVIRRAQHPGFVARVLAGHWGTCAAEVATWEAKKLAKKVLGSAYIAARDRARAWTST